MRLPSLKPLRENVRTLCAIAIFPLGTTTAGLVLTPRFWLYFVVAAVAALYLAALALEALATGRIEDHWGRIERADQPTRYWLQIAIWTALVLCATAFPLVIGVDALRK